MNTKQLTYPTIESQKQFWIDKEAQSNNATPETRDQVYLCENCGTPVTGKFYIAQAGTNKRWHWSKCDASNLSKPDATTADPKPEELSRTESLTDWYDHGRNDENREDLRDEGRNPDGSGESYAERNV